MLDNNNENENSVTVDISELEKTDRIVPRIFQCSISGKIMVKTVMDIEKGNFYDKTELLNWLEENRTGPIGFAEFQLEKNYIDIPMLSTVIEHWRKNPNTWKKIEIEDKNKESLNVVCSIRKLNTLSLFSGFIF